MKFKKISKVLALYLAFINIAPNYSFATESSIDDRYEYFNGDNLTVDNILEEQSLDITIKGKTLANLANIDSDYEIRDFNGLYKDFTVCETSKLKLNTDYTLIVEKETLSNHSNNYNNFEIGISNSIGSTEAHPTLKNYNEDNSYTGLSFSFNTAKTKEVVRVKVRFLDFHNYKYFSVRPIRRYSEAVFTEYCNANIKLVLLEGDYTNTDIRYFKDIQSVGEGQDSISIKYIGKNLYPYGDVTSTWSNAHAQSLIGWIKVKPNTTYTASRKSGSSGLTHFLEYRTNEKVFTVHNECYSRSDGREFRLDGSKDTITFTTGPKINYLYVTMSSGALSTDPALHSQVMLEEGDTKTEYEPYTESIVNIPLSKPLRSISDNTYDRIVKKDGKWYIERNCEEVVVNLNNSGFNTTYWSSQSFDGGGKYYAFYVANSSLFGVYNTNIIYESGTLLTNIWANIGNISINKEGVAAGLTAQPPYLGFKIIRSTIEEYDGTSVAAKAVNYLKSFGDMKFILKLKAPKYELLNIEDLNKTLNIGTTHIYTDSKTSPDINFSIDRAVNLAYKYVELAKEEPTSENISQARYWSNLLRESILKDNLQNNINSIKQTTDLIVEPKTVSVNSDIYIKMKNNISLSLDTNSIIFEEVDTTENVEKQEAVKLTVTSSLPYKVNTYLSSPIVGLDSSNRLDCSIINIKSSKHNVYHSFIDLNTALTILDNQEAGVDNVHNIDLRLALNKTEKTDIYKTTLKFEIEQK